MTTNQFFKRKRNKRRNRKRRNLYWAKACVELLERIQRAAMFLNPAFYRERKVPHYSTLFNSISQSVHSEEQSIRIIEKELFIYKSFAELNPRHISEWGKALKSGEDEFSAIVNERHERHTCHRTGLRYVAKKLLMLISTPHFELFIEINEELAAYGNTDLQLLLQHITIHINFL
jgi:hypothetical protein